MSNLAKRTDIVINKADKGSTIVIMNKSDYIDRGNKHLSDTSTYEPLQQDITNELKREINLKLDKLHENGLYTHNKHAKILQTTQTNKNIQTILPTKNSQEPHRNMANSIKLQQHHREYIRIHRPLVTT